MKENKQIESGTEFLESIEELKLDFENIKFESVLDVSKTNIKNTKVYDLEVSENHNYHVGDLGIVHNGGGKL